MYLKSRKQNTGELLMPNFFQKKLSPCLFMPAISNRWGSVYNPIFPTFKINLPKKLGIDFSAPFRSFEFRSYGTD